MAGFQRVVSIVELAGVGAAAVAAAIGTAVVRRRGGMPWYGDQLRDADPAIRAEVWRSLKAGSSDDPEVDALARRVAARTLRGGISSRSMAAMIVALALLPLLNLLDRDPPWLTVAAQASGVGVLVALAALAYVCRRRSRRYLRGRPVARRP